jgi:hypothetical protein
MRILDEDGAAVVASLPEGPATVFTRLSIPAASFVSESHRVPSLTRVAAVEFELARSNAAAVIDFDQLAISATFDAPVLDTLYEVRGASLPSPEDNPHNVVMTYYHGHDSTPFVFTGFSLWAFRRPQIEALADFVLQRMWGLARTPSAPAARGR